MVRESKREREKHGEVKESWMMMENDDVGGSGR